MLKLSVFFVCTCVICVINCEYLCDINDIIDRKSGEPVSDKNEFCKNKICVLRACKKGILAVYKNKTRNCTTIDDFTKLSNKPIDQVPIYKSDYQKELIPSDKNLSHFHFISFRQSMGKLVKKECVGGSVKSTPQIKMYILEDGSLLIRHKEDSLLYPGSFLLEFHMQETKDGEWSGPQIIVRALKTVVDHTRDIYLAIGMIISCVFSILLLVVYSMFKSLRGTYGLYLMAYVACFAMTFALQATQTLWLLYHKKFEETDCKYISTILYFVWMSTFFWLNVISIDIWSTFRPKNTFRSIKSHGNKRRICLACLYGFGVPFLIVVAAVVIDKWNLINTTPQFGNCMHSRKVKAIYLYGPVTLTLCVNVLAFLMTTYYFLMETKKKNALNSEESRTTNRKKNQFLLYVKLSISTGLNWVLDIFGAYVDLPISIDYILNTYNLFLGVTLFIICVCNEKVLKLICKRFGFKNRFVTRSSANESHSHRENVRKTSSVVFLNRNSH